MTRAPYAATPETSRGRRHPEPPSALRDEFQRDRDRIVHSTAFRRLEYKTQVFVNHEGDLFRTRLTHSLEVAQIGRTIARTLGLHEDLTEAIALAHDLGHTPFGHAGQDELNRCMAPYGGFEHNLQSLRIVDHLELRYADFPGLNLCFEAREGIIKHCSADNARAIGDVGVRFLQDQRPTLEAQLCNLADEIAYNNHDIDDGLRSGLVSLEHLATQPLFGVPYAQVKQAYPQLTDRRLIHETIRRIIDRLVNDLVETTRQRLASHTPASVDEVRAAPPLVAFSDAMLAAHQAMKQFLRHNLYRHSHVVRMTGKAKRVIRELFAAYQTEPRLLPQEYQRMVAADGPRAIADYIAGMTDRYAVREHRQLFSIGDNDSL